MAVAACGEGKVRTVYTPWDGLWHTPSVPCSSQRPALDKQEAYR